MQNEAELIVINIKPIKVGYLTVNAPEDWLTHLLSYVAEQQARFLTEDGRGA